MKNFEDTDREGASPKQLTAEYHIGHIKVHIATIKSIKHGNAWLDVMVRDAEHLLSLLTPPPGAALREAVEWAKTTAELTGREVRINQNAAAHLRTLSMLAQAQAEAGVLSRIIDVLGYSGAIHLIPERLSAMLTPPTDAAVRKAVERVTGHANTLVANGFVHLDRHLRTLLRAVQAHSSVLALLSEIDTHWARGGSKTKALHAKVQAALVGAFSTVQAPRGI